MNGLFSLTPKWRNYGYIYLHIQYLKTMSENFPSETESHHYQQPEETTKPTNLLIDIFKPVNGYFVTPLLIIVTSLIFVAMVFSGVNFIAPDVETMIQWGANFRPVTLNNGFWRLLTSCFLHYGIIHLLMNMYALFYIGKILEPYLGKTRFITAYLLTGIAGSAASLYWNDYTASAGASGAVFGMYGIFLALMTTRIVHPEIRKSLTTSMMLFIGYNLFYGIASDSGIDNAAHVGGLISGFVMGYAFIPGMKQSENKGLNRLTITAIVVTVLLPAGIIYKSLSNDFEKYNTHIQQFAQLEQQALSIYKLPQPATFEKQITTIHFGITSWEKSIQLLSEVNQMNVSKVYKDQSEKLKEYCEIRLRVFRIMQKAIEENTEKYIPEIDRLNLQIDSMLTVFNAE